MLSHKMQTSEDGGAVAGDTLSDNKLPNHPTSASAAGEGEDIAAGASRVRLLNFLPLRHCSRPQKLSLTCHRNLEKTKKNPDSDF